MTHGWIDEYSIVDTRFPLSWILSALREMTGLDLAAHPTNLLTENQCNVGERDSHTRHVVGLLRRNNAALVGGGLPRGRRS
jgi:hypothetical protein